MRRNRTANKITIQGGELILRGAYCAVQTGKRVNTKILGGCPG
jgi:hypothetical protein